MEKCRSEKPNDDKLTLREKQALEISNFVLRHQKLVTYLETMLRDCLDILPEYRYVDFERDLETVKARFSHEGISFATNTLPSFFDAILHALETGIFEFPGYKLKSGAALPRFLYGITHRIFGNHAPHVKVDHMRCLFQLCVSFKKLIGPFTDEVLSDQLAEFVSVDKGLPDFDGPLDVFTEKILSEARALITEMCRDLEVSIAEGGEGFKPRPGPGATNTPTQKHERFRPRVLYRSLNKAFPYSDWFYHQPRPVQSGRWDLRVGNKAPLPDLPVERAPSSRFKFVHKTYGKPRCICIEELETQWLQQALRRALVKCIEEHPVSKGFVSFRKQCINADLALTASADRIMATIDMSAASDRISRSLVAALFRDLPRLSELLLACSTRTITLPPGHRIKTLYAKKYAPMGSAVCFPVMGLVHFALIRSLGSFFSPPYVEIPDVYVYGDDIIVTRELAIKVFKFLPLFGMKLNQKKSFLNSHFRESCGMNAFHGVDITPTRFKVIVSFPPCNKTLVTALSNEGDLYKKGFRHTARLIREEILHVKAYGAQRFPFVRRESGLLGWIREAFDAPERTNYARRWNTHLHRYEYSALVIREVTDKPPLLNDVEGYLRVLLLDVQEQDARFTGGLPGEFHIRRQWVPSSAFFTNAPECFSEVNDVSFKVRGKDWLKDFPRSR